MSIFFPSKKELLEGAEVRIHMDDVLAINHLSNGLCSLISEITGAMDKSEIVILCIGTDRSTGDSLGPLIGSKLSDKKFLPVTVYGTLDKPVHASNLLDYLKEIEEKYNNPLVVAIDACLGRVDSVGYITLRSGPLKPGAGVNKSLPPVGDIHITGVVNVGGFMEYFVLQNTRLSLVMRMATIISMGINRSIVNLQNT